MRDWFVNIFKIQFSWKLVEKEERFLSVLQIVNIPGLYPLLVTRYEAQICLKKRFLPLYMRDP
jgi:hypothetical protein